MQASRKIRRTVVATVAVLAAGAPAAGAVPMYDGYPSHAAATAAAERAAYSPEHPSADMHASTVGTTFDTTVTGGDLRTENTRSPGGTGGGPVADIAPGTPEVVPGDLRGEASRPLPAPAQAVAVDDGDDPVDWPLVGLILAGTVALAGATFVLGRRTPGHAH